MAFPDFGFIFRIVIHCQQVRFIVVISLVRRQLKPLSCGYYFQLVLFPPDLNVELVQVLLELYVDFAFLTIQPSREPLSNQFRYRR